MKQTLLLFAGYNIWANKKIIDVLLKLNEEKLLQNITSSFPTIKATVYHTWSSEFIWLQRLQLAEHPVWVESTFEGSFNEACAKWQEASAQLLKFIEVKYDDKAFEHVIQYYNLKNEPMKKITGNVLLHAFNHSTYHRGQLVTMLRQVGVKKIPSTDLFNFVK